MKAIASQLAWNKVSSTPNQLPFQAVQAEFAAHIRDPDSSRGPLDVELRRMAVYKRLFYDNIESFCAKSFKSFKTVVDDEYWHSLIRNFIKNHRCETPYFREIPNEFLQFLMGCEELDERYPFIVELCHFDLVRIELYFSPESIGRRGTLTSLETRIQRSPLVRLLSYQWPVHNIDENYTIPASAPDATWLIAHRDRQNKVEFLVSNPRTFRMLEMLENARSGWDLIHELAEELDSSADSLSEQAFQTLETFVRSGVVVLSGPDN
ncbi:MAG: hypothetical protein F4X44_01870 [Gammaproteobacteria bacterium]|nr:hypothetical protein [Gammaproteobacteria bacterium]